MILAGDHLQLPPTIISKEAAGRGLDRTLMKRLIDELGAKCTRMLTVQYRMNTLICSWISAQLYESRLGSHASVAGHVLADLPNVQRTDTTSSPLVLIDTDGCEMRESVVAAAAADDKSSDEESSKANEGEANIACRHVCELIESGVSAESIGVITPYNLQVELIKAKLQARHPAVEVKSVDGFQGREKEAIVLSLVRSNLRGEVGFLSDQRRINVAITRARRHLCVIGDAHTCQNDPFLKSFLAYCEQKADVRSGFDYRHDDEATAATATFEDITFAKLRVVNDVAKQSKSATKNLSKSDR